MSALFHPYLCGRNAAEWLITMKRKLSDLLLALLLCLVLLTGCGADDLIQSDVPPATTQQAEQPPTTSVEEDNSQQLSFDLSQIPEYTGDAYVAVNDNLPFFTDDEITDQSFETYSPLDALGRCGVAFACVGQDLMPTEDRGSIGQVKPSGWHLVKIRLRRRQIPVQSLPPDRIPADRGKCE